MSTRFKLGRLGVGLALIGLVQVCRLGLLAAELLPPGFRPVPPGVHALVGGRIVIKPGQVLDRGTIIVRDGLITDVGQEANVPADARVWDMQNSVIYAGFIDPWLLESGSEPPTPAPPDETQAVRLSLTSPGLRFYGTPGAALDSGETGPGYPLSRITPERRIATSYSPRERQLAPLRELGFAAGVVVPAKGILRGTSALVLLEEASPNRIILRPDVFQHIALDAQPSDDRAFPGSLMGVIASVRQTFFDARHYALEQAAYREAPQGRKRPEYNTALEALLPASTQKMRVAFEPGSALMVDRAARIADELGLDAFLLSSGQEWRRPDLARATKAVFVVPLDFPELPKLPTEDDWEQVRLDQLRAWDWAPENPAILRREGLEVALTTHGLSDKKKFRDNLRLAIARGLSEEDAIAALTTVPARLCGVEKQLGTIERGKMANLTVVQGRSYFEPEAKVRAVWIEGRVYRPPADESKPQPGSETIGETSAEPGLPRPGEAPEQQPKPPEVAEAPKPPQTGEATKPGNQPGEKSEKPDVKKQQQTLQLMKQRVARSPQQGRGALAEPAVLLLENATLWSCGPQGVLTNADLLVRNGRIEAIGRGLRGRAGADAVVLDATGRHVTPGLIDAHSHAAILGGVNESSVPSSAMVRIGDVINSETENIYQQLAGGLTVANLLHGSANPIGGQNVVIKLRWGASPDGLVFKEAPAGIKFALGENPKQANWGEKFVTRFPQTRMGVRTFIANRFTAASQYIAEWEKCRQAGSEGFLPPRRDLELEAIAEIIEGRRWIYCHAYRQDEMIMLMRLMEDFGVRIGSFEHVLEGYKVADEIARHGASASTFSDWWAYKFEVYDAIPYNGSLLRERGVQVVFNSDSSEMARRLNTEAAKAVKFGATPEPEALKFVTLNPAKQLRIEEYVGSLEPGKHADFVVWSRPPLDSTTACLQTWIEGKKYFDRDLAPRQAEALETERSELLAKAKRLAKAGAVAADKNPAALSFFLVCLEHEHAGEDRGCHSGH